MSCPDGASRLSCWVLSNTVYLSNLSSDLPGLSKLGCVSLIHMKFVYGLKMEWWRLSNTWIFKAFTVGLWMLPKHTYPITTQPLSKRWPKGASCGPLTCCLTLCALRTSPPSSRSISTAGSSSGMCLAMRRRWGWCKTTLGVGISQRLFGISGHSRRDGREMTTLLSIYSIWNPSAFNPYVPMTPEQVLRL